MQIALAVFFVFAASALFLSQLLPFLGERVERRQLKKAEAAAAQLDKMFVDVRRERLTAVFVLLPLGLGTALYFLFPNVLVLVAGVLAGSLIPAMVVKKMEEIRQARFHGQLVDAVLILSSSLKSGLSIMQAIEVVVEEMPSPISQECNLLLNQTKMGVTLEEALERLNKRMRSEELNMLVTSITVSRQTGGDLGKIFDRLVYCIRQKVKITQQVKTLTTQARWQGIILMVLPIIFAASVFKMDPTFFEALLTNEKGRALLIYAIFSQLIGMVLIRKFAKVVI